MKDLKAVVSEYHRVDLSKLKAALATVVQVRGSSYRSPGARMLITEDGKWVGSISGGCLEGDALRKARQVMNSNLPMTVTYDTHEESNQNLGIGLGCNGVIDVLIEPISAHSDNVIHRFESLIETERPLALATIFDGASSIGDKLLINEKKEIISSFKDEALTNLVISDLCSVFTTQNSEARKYALQQETVSVFLELIQPSLSLIIFGGGFDARPVSHLAKSLGWNVTVTDECVAHIAPLFFPTADKLSLCHRQWIDRDFKITPYTACVLMSHNYAYDRDVLKKLIYTETPYIGILGPRKRFEKMMMDLKRDNIELPRSTLERIHSPIGLDIGAEAPDEIAVAIVAEIQSKFSNRSGGFLRYRTGPIHKRDTVSDQVFKQVYLNETQTTINPDTSYG